MKMAEYILSLTILPAQSELALMPWWLQCLFLRRRLMVWQTVQDK